VDNAGNSTGANCPYRVRYNFLGFQGLKGPKSARDQQREWLVHAATGLVRPLLPPAGSHFCTPPRVCRLVRGRERFYAARRCRPSADSVVDRQQV